MIILLIVNYPTDNIRAAISSEKSISENTPPKINLTQQIIDNVRKETIEQAEKMMSEKPVMVTASSCKRSAGGRHDFYSEGDYWWPDPANPAGPYIQKDGQSNPENFSDHRLAMVRFSDITATLTSAWLLTGNPKYAAKALEHLDAWLVDTTTMMNPDMLYAQAIWGRFTGRSIGLIDGGSIVVSSKYVNQPVAVRYAFSGGAMTNLMNREGIAAFPFRTDIWDSATYAKIPESEQFER